MQFHLLRTQDDAHTPMASFHEQTAHKLRDRWQTSLDICKIIKDSEQIASSLLGPRSFQILHDFTLLDNLLLEEFCVD